jgi:hypothetical protein
MNGAFFMVAPLGLELGTQSRPRIGSLEGFHELDKSPTGRNLDKLSLLETTVPSILDTAFSGLSRTRR